ncbi:hypothetical protein [Dactylosporangium sp. CA-139066]|uniref:hypothetical protein n=1 Tax=Dactylosporangium sp. CA-139066 TaxID=3239930 RepID=UPI003D903C18
MKRRWIVTGVVAWAVVVTGFALYSSLEGTPTAREQTTIADALPTVDAALGHVYAALDPQASVAVLGGYRRAEMSCRVTSAREGTRFTRELIVYVHKAAEGPTLDRVKGALPASYQASVAHHDDEHLLTADAGNFVAVHGASYGPGVLRFTADTGCRPQNAPVVEATPASQNANRAPVEAVLSTLGTTASQWRTHRLTCPDGGALWTVEAVTTGDGAKARATVPAAAIILDQEKTFAYRAGAAGVSFRTEDGNLVVASTAGC